ncbi:MAG TPA: phosphoribosyltransferase [Anaeromyxobacteraceae bacterium]|nr:phosphoribosyltransferase [Anaeromyxobacteraceae bacterium]
MPPARKKPGKKPAPKKAAARKPTRKAAPRAARKGARPAKKAAGAEHEQFIGMALADGYALQRLKAPARMKSAPKRSMREIGWATFGELARQLATRISKRFRPEAVLGIAKGGVFVGSAVASVLDTDFYPVRVESRRRDASPMPEASEQFPELKGKRVLVVDDVCQTGATLAKARRQAKKAGAKDVRSATLVVRPGGARPDFHAVETSELVLFGWDYQLDQTDAGHGGACDGDDTDPAETGV